MGDQPPTFDPLLEAFLAQRDVACPSCGYNLRGLQSTTCPECRRDLRLALFAEDRWTANMFLLSIAAAVPMALYAGIRIVQALAQFPRMVSTGLLPRLYFLHFGVGMILNATIVALLSIATIRVLLATGPEAVEKRRRSFVRAVLLCAALNGVFICIYAVAWMLGIG